MDFLKGLGLGNIGNILGGATAPASNNDSPKAEVAAAAAKDPEVTRAELQNLSKADIIQAAREGSKQGYMDVQRSMLQKLPVVMMQLMDLFSNPEKLIKDLPGAMTRLSQIFSELMGNNETNATTTAKAKTEVADSGDAEFAKLLQSLQTTSEPANAAQGKAGDNGAVDQLLGNLITQALAGSTNNPGDKATTSQPVAAAPAKASAPSAENPLANLLSNLFTNPPKTTAA